MNEENEWSQAADADTLQGAIEGVMREDILEAFIHLKIGRTPGPSEVYAKMILASGDVGIRVLMELCQRTQDGKWTPADWATSAAIPIFKGE